MKKILVIGSTVVDVIINLEEYLPKTGQDVHIRSQQMSLGGCAYNVSDSIRHFQVPYVLFSPVGTGAYGDFVRNALTEKGISSPIPTPAIDNGCCYCFIEKTGERTFISYHGAEYLFEKEWFSLLDPNEFDSVYICGLEIEERTGNNIIEFLENNPDYVLAVGDNEVIDKDGILSGEYYVAEFEEHSISTEDAIDKLDLA